MTTILDQIIKEKAKEVETLLNQTFEQIDSRVVRAACTTGRKTPHVTVGVSSTATVS